MSTNRPSSIYNLIQHSGWKYAAILFGNQCKVGWFCSQLCTDWPISLAILTMTCSAAGFIVHFAQIAIFSEPGRGEPDYRTGKYQRLQDKVHRLMRAHNYSRYIGAESKRNKGLSTQQVPADCYFGKRRKRRKANAKRMEPVARSAANCSQVVSIPRPRNSTDCAKSRNAN